MSELHNPLFEEEKEFLERKKLEYERALRGDVDHIKDQSVMVGKVALVGAGLAGGIWLITKAFGGKKRKRHAAGADAPDGFGSEADDDDDESGPDYYTAGNGKRYKSKAAPKSAADSASAFMEHAAQAHESDDLGLGSKAATPAPERPAAPMSFAPEAFEDDPFRDLPYDDSRRLPASPAFDKEPAHPANSRSRMIGSVLQAFLQSDTGKVLVGQVAAVGLALITKKVSGFFPAAKNSDLAASSGYAAAPAGAAPAATSATPAPSDASTPLQSV